jgi:shikimate kinase
VVLVGPPGSGKTTVASLLAARLGRSVRDTDADVEARAGQPVADLFVGEGEAVFRDLEEQAVAAALSEHDGVLALGGGAVVRQSTRERLAGHRVVFLDAGLAASASRVGLGVSRPLLLGNVRGQLHALLAQRRPLYEEVATWTVGTDDRTPEQVADAVVGLIAAERSTGASGE